MPLLYSCSSTLSPNFALTFTGFLHIAPPWPPVCVVYWKHVLTLWESRLCVACVTLPIWLLTRTRAILDVAPAACRHAPGRGGA